MGSVQGLVKVENQTLGLVLGSGNVLKNWIKPNRSNTTLLVSSSVVLAVLVVSAARFLLSVSINK
jgi:hypothetical protein